MEHSSVPVAALSHIGRKRKENEDRYGVSSFYLESQPGTPALLGVLCDGVGGHRAGEVAAEMAVEWISQLVAQSDGGDPLSVLDHAIRSASEAIREQATRNPAHNGMGSTCACALMIGQRLYTATVGDSRVYLLRNGRILRLSTDHTWVQEALEYGLIHPEDANGHPNAHVIRRYLGSPEPPEVDFRLRLMENETDAQAERNQGLRLFRDDRILLTSDGLTDLVEDAEILAAFQQLSPDEAARQLAETANARGGHDNITLVTFPALPWGGHAQETTRAQRTRRPVWRWLRAGCLAVAMVVLAAVGLGAGAIWLERMRNGNPALVLTGTPTPGLSVTQLPGETPEPALTPTAEFTPTLLESTPSDPTLTPWPTNTP